MSRSKARKTKTARKLQRIDVEMKDLEAILERAESGPLDDADRETLRAAFETLFAVTTVGYEGRIDPAPAQAVVWEWQ